MLEVRRSTDRGVASFGWLESRHTFSFGEYYDARHQGYGPLRVINEDRVQPSQGFGAHGHRNMEIISYVLDGALEHKDSMGNGSVLRYGDVQRMSAGSGVRHSEYNHSKTDSVHFLQIWIEPNVAGTEPSYAERHFDTASKQGRLRLIVSADGRGGSVPVLQDVSMYAAILGAKDRIEQVLNPLRLAYVHVARGQVEANGIMLQAGDGLKIREESLLVFERANDAEILLFDLPH